MKPSAEDQIESIVSSLEEKGIPAAPVEQANALATAHPKAVGDLALAVMRRFPKGGTFLDGALSYLPQEGWPKLVEHALDVLDAATSKNEAAESVIAYASLQCPAALHPYLTRIFLLRPNAGCYYEKYPWRESGESHFDYLRKILERRTSTDEERQRAWTAMIQTRHPKVTRFALAHTKRARLSSSTLVQAHLHLVGFHQEERSLERTCCDVAYHLQFPAAYFRGQSRPPWLARTHPTWKLPSSRQTMPFGGNSKSRCSHCGEQLHRLLVLDPIPPGLGITRLTRLELATCLSCLGWDDRQPLFYRHEQDSPPLDLSYDGHGGSCQPPIKPQFPVGPLKKGKVFLAQTPARWYWQDWALSNGRENLNRIGGEPCWIQDSEYPDCPSCERLMTYLIELDSNLPEQDGGEWLWGSGGIGYGFWCDHCKISGFLWQCT